MEARGWRPPVRRSHAGILHLPEFVAVARVSRRWQARMRDILADWPFGEQPALARQPHGHTDKTHTQTDGTTTNTNSMASRYHHNTPSLTDVNPEGGFPERLRAAY